MKKNLRLLGYGILFTAIVLLDRISKLWALSCEPHEVFPCVSFDLVLNRGISWGLFSSAPAGIFWVLTSINALIILGVAWYAVYSWLQKKSVLGHLFICAGALSNLIDRFQYHGVIDFILLSCKGWSFPIFNVADMSIVLGVFLLLLTNYEDL